MSRPFSAPPMARAISWEIISSLGESAAETALLLRAGIRNVSLSRFIDDSGQRVKLCPAPAILADVLGPERLVALAAHAIHALLPQLARIWARDFEGRLALAIALPERFSEQGGSSLNADGRAFMTALEASLPPELKSCPKECFPFGRAAGALAMQRSCALAAHGHVVICGGVDSQYDWPTLEALANADRLLTNDNVDGVRPGEGAAFLALVDPGADGASSTDVHVFSIGLGREPHPIGSEEPSQAVGLSTALESAVKPLRAAGMRSNCWLLDNSHENYATEELQIIIARFGDVLGLETDLQMPLRELGDVGAAALPLLVALGAEAWRRGYANDTVAVATGCSDQGARGAVLFGMGQSWA